MRIKTRSLKCVVYLSILTFLYHISLIVACAETATKVPPACIEERISRGDFSPCNSCALESKMKNAMADYLDGRSLQAMAAGIRNSIQPQGIVDDNTPFVKSIAAEVLRGKAKPEDIKVCQIPDGPLYVIQYKSLLGVHGYLSQGGQDEMGKW